MKTVLSCELPVIRYAVFAEMAWMERRPELGLLCQTVLTNGRRFTSATIQTALPGLSDAGAKNILAWCKTLGLSDLHGGLTKIGESVAQSNDAPVPEQGVYGFWMVAHPLTGRRILAVERLSSRVEQRVEDIRPLPAEMQPDRDKLFRSVINKNERFVVRDLPANHGQPGCVPGETKGVCRLEWTLDFDANTDHWRFDGRLETQQGGTPTMKSMGHEPESDHLDLWRLMEVWGQGPLAAFGRWNSAERRLAVPFSRLSETEMDLFGKTFTLPSAEVLSKGSYNNVKLEDVPIGPASKDDAQRWATSRFERLMLNRPVYRSRAEIRDRFVELVESTPLEKFTPTLPAHGDLLKTYEKVPETYWSIAAPVDLSPTEVSTDELAALHVGIPAKIVPAQSTTGIVRIPYRGGWTMKQFVDELLAAHMPRRILLCDRYVRGADNLKTLELFVQAIRSGGAAIAIDVWTDEDGADFKQIQAITGTAPRKFREVFGRYAPHDRYVLVQNNPGQGIGWQLSNSPLHARAEEPGATHTTPLRWKDLSGTSVLPDELEPALRQWILGGAR